MENRTRMQKLSAFLSGAAIVLFVLVVLTLAVGSHFVTAHESNDHVQTSDVIVYWQDNFGISLLKTICALGILLLLERILKMGKGRFRLSYMVFGLWLAITVFWICGVRMRPRTDPLRVVNAAEAFAIGDYSPLTETTYLEDASHQLGICLVLEIMRRLFPLIDLPLTVQLLNVLLTLSAVYAMAKVTQGFIQSLDSRRSLYALYLLFLPMPLFCVYVYGTVPMIALIAWGVFFFAKYLQKERARDGLLFALCIGLAALLKPNATVSLVAFVIIACLHAIQKKNARVLAYVLIGALLSVYLPKIAVWQYEVRSGVTLRGSYSMLAYLVMGLQDSARGPGWYNGYITQFSASIMPHEEATAIILADLKDRLTAFAADPAMLWQFMKDKCISLWLEPTHSSLWIGSVSEMAGRFNGLGYLVYREGSAFRLLLEHAMDAYQQALYVLCVIGGISTFRRRGDMMQALLPTIFLGGVLFHQLFEAQSQYTYVYAFFLMPLAAQGLTALGKAADGIAGRIRKTA